MLLPCQYCPGTDNVVQEGLALWATNKNTFIVVMRFVVFFFFCFGHVCGLSVYLYLWSNNNIVGRPVPSFGPNHLLLLLWLSNKNATIVITTHNNGKFTTST